jgi:phosphate starvation-inducible protein PhoH
VDTLFFRHKNGRQIELRVDWGDLLNEKEQLTSFLQSHLQVSVTLSGNKLRVNSEKLSAQELRRVVTKFLYHRNFNNTHWVSTEETTIKINRFKRTAKKTEKHKRSAPHQTEIQSWGL